MIHRFLLLLLMIFSCLFTPADAQPFSLQDRFEEGYLTSKLEDRLPDYCLRLEIKEGVLTLYQFPHDPRVCEEIFFLLQNNCDYVINFDRTYQPANCCLDSQEICDQEGDWLPELSSFFPTMLAQPHIIGYSAGYRTYDKVVDISCLPVSIGDQFSLYQFKTRLHGRLYFGIEACVWAIFEAKAKSLSLINADYYIALPLTYIHGKFSSRLRLYHQSSHLGDEFLLENRQINRLNPSMEVVDLSLAYELTPQLTSFLGYTRVIRSDDSYKIKPNGIYYGFNYDVKDWKIKLCNLEASPYIATYFTNLEDHNWKLDSSLAVGYQWDKQYGHKFRAYIEAHEGFSHEGQFSKKRTRYIAFKVLYGY